MKEVVDKINETVNEYMPHVVRTICSSGFYEDVVEGYFPVAVEHEGKYYKSEITSVILAGKFIFYANSIELISIDEYIELATEKISPN